MANAKKKRRRSGRTTAKSEPQSPMMKIAAENYRMNGALGLVGVVAHIANWDVKRSASKDTDVAFSSADIGRAFINEASAIHHKLGAQALACIASVWPDEQVRAAATTAVKGRSNQPAGINRHLDRTFVRRGIRLTDEFRDSEVLLFEFALAGRQPMTLSANTHAFRRGWVEFALFDKDAETAADNFVFDADQPGHPRQIVEPLTENELRWEAWMLGSHKRTEGEQCGPILRSWLARLLDVDVEFPEVPKFEFPDAEEDGPDVADELDTFLSTEARRVWRGEVFEDLIDHLLDYEYGDRAMHWSPDRVEDFLLFHWAPENAEVPYHALPALLRQWVQHCAAITRQRKPLLSAVSDEIDRCEPEFFHKLGTRNAA